MKPARAEGGRTGYHSKSPRKRLGNEPYRENFKRAEKGNEIPRRCLVIKRSHPEADVERTELRLVTYQKSGSRLDQSYILLDAARYLQDRADDAECGSGRETRSSSTYSTTTADRTTTSTEKSGDRKSKSSVSSSTAPSETRKRTQMAERKKLRESLENLVAFFARRADETGDREWSVITGIAERLLFDVAECIQTEEPLSRDLITRIKGLKKLAKEATMKATGGGVAQQR